jgi:hypothetical protein
MKRTFQEKGMYFLAILFATAPFAFGIIRFLRTGRDLRILWLAFASLIGAFAVRMIAKERSPKSTSAFLFSGLTFVVSALLGGLTGYLLGATAGAGVWGVAIVLAISWAASYFFYTLSSPRPTH